MDRRGGHAGCLHRCHRCDAAVGDRRQAHPERTGVGPVGESGGDRAQCRGDAPRCGGAPRGPVALRSRCSEVARLRGRRRKAEELGDDGFGGAQHRSDQRRQVEVALAGGAHDAGQDLLGVGAVAGAVAAAHLADDHGGPDGLFGAPVGGVERGVPQVLAIARK